MTVPLEESDANTAGTMLPGVVTLGDILESQGYNQVFLIGSDGEFGGRKPYFTQHGNYDVEDYYYFQEAGKIEQDRWVWWGFEDMYLFDFAKEKLTELSQASEPFNLTMLTVDTHFEDGYVCERRGNEYGDNQYANVISCSDWQVYEFVSWIQKQDFYENTTIVISGDHPTMDADFCENIDSEYERKVYTAYINAATDNSLPEQRREFTTFDNFPTTLASLGVAIEGERLGLGTNLFSNMPTLLEMYGEDRMDTEMGRDSQLLSEIVTATDKAEVIISEEIKAPSANVWTSEYDWGVGTFIVTIDSFVDVEDMTKIQGINIAVWTAEDRSDQQWVQAFGDENSVYRAEVFVPDFEYKTGNYYIEAYMIDNNGNQYLLGNAIGYVE